MSNYLTCIASPVTSAGAFIVTTKAAMFYGVSLSGSASATVINVHNGATTVTSKVFSIRAPAAAAAVDVPPAPVMCPNGIIATNIGTVTAYLVLYANVV